MTDELKERVKALAVEAGGVPLRENCLDAEAFPWGVEMELDALVRLAQAVAHDCAAVCDNAWQIDGSFSAKELGDLVRARFGLAS